MTRRSLAAFLCTVAVAASVAVAGPAAAAPPPRTGCPGGYDLVTLDFVLERAAPGFEDAIIAADENRDEFLCFKLLPEPIPLFEPTFLFDDNRFPSPGS
jgi:hypothetical protein